MTDVTIEKNGKGSWEVVCMSGVIEGTYTELANAEFYCNECGYTWEVISENQNLQNEIDILAKNARKVKAENTVVCTRTVKRGYTYRKSTLIKAGDLNL